MLAGSVPQGMTVDSHKLEIFTKIAELKSYSQAARYLSLTQPTVSHHMTALEEMVGLPLFDRNGKEVLLTPAGEILYRYSRRMHTVVEQACQTLSFFRGKKTGAISIVAGHLLGEYVLPTALRQFLDAFPHAMSRIRIADHTDVVTAVLDGEADLGFVGARLQDARLDCRLFLSDELVFVVPRGHRWWQRKTVKPIELPEEPFVARLQDSCLREVCDRTLAASGVRPESLRVVVEMGSITAVKQAVKSGYGIALLPLLAVQEELDQNLFKAVRLGREKLAKNFFMISDSRRPPTPLAEEFVRILGTSS